MILALKIKMVSISNLIPTCFRSKTNFIVLFDPNAHPLQEKHLSTLYKREGWSTLR